MKPNSSQPKPSGIVVPDSFLELTEKASGVRTLIQKSFIVRLSVAAKPDDEGTIVHLPAPLYPIQVREGYAEVKKMLG